jgi:hypothetical protein
MMFLISAKKGVMHNPVAKGLLVLTSPLLYSLPRAAFSHARLFYSCWHAPDFTAQMEQDSDQLGDSSLFLSTCDMSHVTLMKVPKSPGPINSLLAAPERG